MQLATHALSFARDSAGNSSAARIAMTAMTTSNSINVKALLPASGGLVLADRLDTLETQNITNSQCRKAAGLRTNRDS